MILVDLNVIQDVVENREPHYAASAAVLDAVIAGRVPGVIPAHSVTTLHYLVSRSRGREVANDAVARVLRHFNIAGVGRNELTLALESQMTDYEDAVVAEAASAAGCDLIVTRNVRDFARARVQSLTPEEYIQAHSP
jgi:predicted nucleic acid-binding protein